MVDSSGTNKAQTPALTGQDIQRFRIDIPQASIVDLNDRLARTRWPSELADIG
jgi:hypothetical protein